jgi:hypothetical protein
VKYHSDTIIAAFAGEILAVFVFRAPAATALRSI